MRRRSGPHPRAACPQVPPARAAAPALWGALGAARGSPPWTTHAHDTVIDQRGKTPQ
jgi:hypothetical protein